MKSLDEIGIETQTDRASQFTRTWGKPHDYARHYDKLFTPLREQPVKMLEIGTGGGEGIQMWMQYFRHSDADFYGVDVVKNTNPWNDTSNDPDKQINRYSFNCGDQSCSTFWACFLADRSGDFDIILDDGSHISKDIITTFNNLWPVLKPGGFYAIEDLNCGYGGGNSMFTPAGHQTHFQFLEHLMFSMNTQDTSYVDSIYFSKELAVLRKKL